MEKFKRILKILFYSSIMAVSYIMIPSVLSQFFETFYYLFCVSYVLSGALLLFNLVALYDEINS